MVSGGLAVLLVHERHDDCNATTPLLTQDAGRQSVDLDTCTQATTNQCCALQYSAPPTVLEANFSDNNYWMSEKTTSRWSRQVVVKSKWLVENELLQVEAEWSTSPCSFLPLMRRKKA